MITIIAAIDENNGIGYKGGLPWPKIPEDMQHFRKTTLGSTVIMGRKTFESIGHALDGRENIVVTSHTLDEDVITVDSLKKALARATKEIYVIGGSILFEEALNFAERLILTMVQGDYNADVFFPAISNQWKIESTKPLGDHTVVKYLRND